MRVAHLIVGLGKGGAETSLIRTLEHGAHRPECVITMLSGEQYYDDAVRGLGIPLVKLDFKRRPVRSLARLASAVRGSDVVCCWMYAACMAGWLTTRGRDQRVVWMIRHTDLSLRNNRLHTVVMARVLALASRSVAEVTFNGQRSLDVHRRMGFSANNASVLDNACDTDRFRPDPAARIALRRELDLADADKVVLSVGRWNPLKDVPLFLQSLASARRQDSRLVGVMCGSGIEPTNADLIALLEANGLRHGRDVHLLGPRDVASLYAGCDVFALHSRAEAFPNVLLEAMASGASCVATDVGDVARIARGSAVEVVPPRDAGALTAAILEQAGLQPAQAASAGLLNRAVVEERFPMERVVAQYESVILGR